MIAQNLMLPDAAEPYPALRVRGKGLVFDDGKLLIKAGATADFATSRNSFALKQWKRYTEIGGGDCRLFLTLRARGRFAVRLVGFEPHCAGYAEALLAEKFFSAPDSAADCETAFPDSTRALIAFRVTAFEDTEVYGGSYHISFVNDAKSRSPRPITLALAICTYKREQFIQKNLRMLNQTVFSNPASPLRDHLWVYIADNGRTLVADDIRGWAGCGAARLLPNPNTGGAGGFSRCILEALSDKDRFGLTHIILMDDDIEFTHEDVERVYAFLRLLKHDRVALGAAMTALDTPWEQVSFGEQFNPLGRITLRKSGINLTRLSSLIRNTVDVPVNYCSWWFCCVPLAVFQASPQDARSDNYDAANMPLPIFVQYDDIEWSVRNAELEKAHLFGVYIRHEAFGKKRGGWKDYYSMRNSLILAALHERRLFNRVGKAYFFFVSFVKILHRIALFRYRDAELLMRAVEDYSQGLERIGAENAEALLVDVRSYAAMKTPVSLFRSLSLIGRLARLILSFAPRAGHIAARYREDAARCVTGGFWRAYLGRNDAL